MSDIPQMTGEAFAFERLRQDPDISFDDVRRLAEATGLVVQPIQYGRARRKLGLTAAGLGASANTVATAAAKPAPAAAKKPARDQKKGSPAFEFLVESLREQPAASYGELKAAADERGFKIAPIMYGRAKALLGLVPVRPRGQGKNRQAAARKQATTIPAATPSNTGRTPTNLDNVRDLESLVRIVRQLDDERNQLRDVLQQISNTIADALRHSGR